MAGALVAAAGLHVDMIPATELDEHEMLTFGLASECTLRTLDAHMVARHLVPPPGASPL
jgi:hypothetical protein